VRRRVALKVIKLGMDTKQVVARFEAHSSADANPKSFQPGTPAPAKSRSRAVAGFSSPLPEAKQPRRPHLAVSLAERT